MIGSKRRRRFGAFVSIVGSVVAGATAVTTVNTSAAGAAPASAASSAGVSYSVYPIANELSGVKPWDINENGQVVASYQKTVDQRLPIVWQNGTATELPMPPDTPGYITKGSALSINNAGLVGGWATKDGGSWAVTWQKQKDGSWSRRDVEQVGLVDDSYGGVTSVNNNGDLLVSDPTTNPTGNDRVLLGGTTAVDLPRRPGAYQLMMAYKINDSATAVGNRSDRIGPSDQRATVWDGGTATELPDGPDGTPGNAKAINANGDVVTVMSTKNADGTYTAYNDVYSSGQYRRIDDLSLAGLPASEQGNLQAEHTWGEDINDKGDVVGEANTVWNGHLTGHAFLNRGGTTFDLNKLIPASSGWELWDARAINNRGQIVGTGTINGVVTGFLLDPSRPVLFVPGAGASQLMSYDDPMNPQELWLGCGTDRNRLSLDPNSPGDQDVRAVDALRYMDCGPVNGHQLEALDAYGTFLDTLTSQYGYHEYRVDGYPSRRTTAGCDMSQAPSNPNLFVFAYDWRKDNKVSADQLADYIGCIRRLHPDQDIDVITHSMGSLVARRYVLDHTPDSYVHQMITIGAPWLGAPKLVDVLNTGNFIKPIAQGSSAVIKKIAAYFPAEHELMAGPYYHDLAGPVFQERGWDFDGDGNSFENYDWAKLRQVFDGKWSTHPASTAADFQTYSNGYGGESDWSNDQTGIQYTHIVGVQAGAATIGKVDAVMETTCAVVCSTRHIFRDEFVRGDGTVPEISAARQANGVDLNAPGADVIRFVSPSSSSDDTVEHTNLTHNPDVIATVVDKLRSDSTSGTQGLVTTKSAVTGASTTANAAPMMYLSVANGADTYVTGPDNATTAFIDGTDVRQQIPGVEHLVTGTDAEDVLLPVAADHAWTYHFTGTGEPISIALRVGDQAVPDFVDRWRDTVVAKGERAELELSSTGRGTLRLDTNGDGQVDEVTAPTAVLAGDDAADADAPTVTVTAHVIDGQRRYAVSADDTGSGVKRIMWSTDGSHFTPYTAPVDGSGTLHAFAEDWAGNRSGIVDVAVDGLPVLPLTAATQSPAPSGKGWTAGTATVTLHATAPSGIKDVTWSADGATKTAETSVAGDTASVDVPNAGTTVLHFRATANDGTVEPWRTLQVRVDAHAPSGRVLAPLPGAVVSSLDQLAGSAADDAAGVASVDVGLQRTSDGQWWNGTAWVADRTSVPAAGTTAWRMTDVPKGADLPDGGYALRITVTDGSDRATVLRSSFVVRQSATYTVTPLATPAGAWDSAAQAIDDDGQVVGSVGVGADVYPAQWRNGTAVTLPVPAGSTGGGASAVLGDGSVAGQVSVGTSSLPARWTPDGQVHLLPVPGGTTQGKVFGGSPAGAAGTIGNYTPVFWPTAGGSTALPNLPGGRGAANDADSRGTIVGYSNNGTSDRPVAWTDGKVRDLGDFGGKGGYAVAINEVGQVVGYGDDGGSRTLPFIGDLNSGQFERIYVGSSWGVANAINDTGTVVGEYATSNVSGAPHHAFSYRNGTLTDLNSLLPTGSGWVLVRAYGINDLGQIVGFGTKDGAGRAFLLSAEHTPDAADVAVTTDAGIPVDVTLAGSDPDPGTSLGYEIVQAPTHGSLSAISGGGVTYTPEKGYTGPDAFSYVADDGSLKSGTATVNITVQPGKAPPNQLPTAAVSGPATTPEGSSITFDASGSADADGTIAAYAWDLNGDGVFDDGTGATATVPAKDDGTITVAVQVTDDQGGTSTATAATTVVNVPPVVSGPATATTTAGAAWSAVVTTSDVPADTLTATVDYDDGTGPHPAAVSGGSVTVAAIYPAAGTHSVVVSVCDDDGGCTAHKMVVTVQPAPAPPPVMGDGDATWGGFVAAPGSSDHLVLAGELHVHKGRMQATLDATRTTRTGAKLVLVTLTKVTSAGVVRTRAGNLARVEGAARLTIGKTTQLVTVVLEVRGSCGHPGAWLEVRNASGDVVEALSLPRLPDGSPILQPLTGAATVR